MNNNQIANKLGEISDGLIQTIKEQSKLASEIVDLLKQLVQPRVLNESPHDCTSNCRREGCPLCSHGKGDTQSCEICDKAGGTWEPRENQISEAEKKAFNVEEDENE